jgi:DNA-binding CsgD family transcriptional regulator
MSGPGAARRVREADVRRILRYVGDLTSLDNPDEFRAGVLPGMRELVPCEIASYNEVEFGAGRMIAVDDPPGSMIPGAPELFVRLGHQNPLIPRYQRTRDGRPYKWSDLITRRQLHATELYREAYAPMKVEFQIAFCLPAPPETIIGLALNRERRDFTEHDRRVLNLIRGPMIQAYRTVQRYAAVVERLAAAERGLASTGVGVVALERVNGALRPAFVSEEAARGLEIEAGESSPLPAAVAGWLSDNEAPGVESAPMLFERADASSVAIQLMPARYPGEPDTLLVEPARELVSIPTLLGAGLTRREAEVMRLVALGRANADVAATLSVSPRTVEKHLQNIFEKLGARSRTQAVLTAWSIGRAPEA